MSTPVKSFLLKLKLLILLKVLPIGIVDGGFMDFKLTKPTTEKLNLDTTELSAEQVRLIKSINSMLTHVMSTESEKEYFTGSSDLLRVVAIAIKQANFNKTQLAGESIDYEQQVLEYCADALIDEIHSGKLVRYDN